MLTTKEALEYVAEASDCLRKVLDEDKAYWDPEPPPSTMAFGFLGRAFALGFPKLSELERRTIADRVEHVLREGDNEAQTAAATGFLEAVLSRTDEDPEIYGELLGYLGPESIKYCRAWNLFTLGHE